MDLLSYMKKIVKHKLNVVNSFYKSKIFFSLRCRLLRDSLFPEAGLSTVLVFVGVDGAAFLLLLSIGVEFVFVFISSFNGDELVEGEELLFMTSVTLLLLSLIIFGPSFTGESLLSLLSLSCWVGLEML